MIFFNKAKDEINIQQDTSKYKDNVTTPSGISGLSQVMAQSDISVHLLT